MDHEVSNKGLSVVSTVHFVKVFEMCFMTEQLAFKATKRKDRAEEEGWLQNEKTEKQRCNSSNLGTKNWLCAIPEGTNFWLLFEVSHFPKKA